MKVEDKATAIVTEFVNNVLLTFAKENPYADHYEWILDYEFTNNAMKESSISFKKLLSTSVPVREKPNPNEKYIFRNNVSENLTSLFKQLEEHGFHNIEVGGTCGGVFFEKHEPWITAGQFKKRGLKGLCDCSECDQKDLAFAVNGIRVSW